MTDFLDVLAQDAKSTVESGYYENIPSSRFVEASLSKSILKSATLAIIAEVKGASPSKGTIMQHLVPEKIADSMVKGGAVSISVLTEPKHFQGSLSNLARVRQSVNVPVLMKDIIVNPAQLNAASKIGANAVLFIQALFDRGHCDYGINEMVAKAHSKGLEVLLETHNLDEFSRAVKTQANLVGINNRNLATLTVNLNVTKNILEKCSKNGRIVVSESGINKPDDLRFLRDCGADAFLIGSAIMLADDVEEKVKEFVKA